ncbi:MAG: 2-C-methyl-D-erythritol 4-phosphate cytidylyltransferase [Bacteroidales bacterium]|nr:2-C-methyl-D-erythritol 4-phosphate cytidylyltransferase [Bacteroidales bacterium]MBR6265575.1 2-C-methyl-D-erythritol 4-phosphate cytidylyltransferase [Bacteroidales bacterium]
MKRFVVIVAGGKGVRMGNAVPKQFLLLNGKPVLQRSLEAFAAFDPTMTCIVVLPETQISYWKDLCEKYSCNVPHVVVSGGKERFDSVKNGLKAISAEGFVAVHDGVRPLVTMEMLRDGFETAEKFGSAIPYVDSVDSLRLIDRETSKTLDRTKIKRIQTPQIFDVSQLKDVMDVVYRPEFTDEASVWELAGKKLYFYKGSEQNIKITTPSDLKIAEVLL